MDLKVLCKIKDTICKERYLVVCATCVIFVSFKLSYVDITHSVLGMRAVSQPPSPVYWLEYVFSAS